MKKILVVNVNWLGDVIFSAPVFRALKEKYPQASISCLAVPRVIEILRYVEGIDELIELNENIFGYMKAIFDLRRRKFEAAFLLRPSQSRSCLLKWAGVPQRVGYEKPGKKQALTWSVTYPNQPVHRRDEYLQILEQFGVSVSDRTCRLNVSADAEKKVALVLANKGVLADDPFIVINPGGNWDLKRWPKEKFVLLIQMLAKEFKGKIIISGAQKDIPLVQGIVQKSKNPETITLAGDLSLAELIALLKRARVVISADSGPLHLANSVGSPVVGLFGPTRPEITGPVGCGKKLILQYDVGCNHHACYYLDCPDNICMKSISVKDVIDAVQQITN